nr:IS4 family transposase [Desulforegula conservatrix]
MYLTAGKDPERPFVPMILTKGQAGVMDRGYQCHRSFDLLQKDDKFFVCRIKKCTTKTVIKENPIKPGSYIFFDAIVLLGTSGINQTEYPLRVVGYKVGNVEYFVATNRCDLSAEQIATIYKLRWKIETFFRWWKQHLKVYHIMSRTEHGVIVQILGGLITYLLMVIYCRKQFDEPVSINRVRELRSSIANDIGPNKNQRLQQYIVLLCTLLFWKLTYKMLSN